MRLIRSILLIATALCVIFPVHSAEPIKIKIGVVAPLSGPSPAWGENLRNGVLMAQEELKTSDRSKLYNYQFLIEDGQGDNVLSIQAYNKLVSVNHVRAVISVFDNVAQAIKPISARQKIIHFGIAIDPNAADKKYNFTHWPPCDAEVALWIKQAHELGIKSVSVIGLNHQFPHSVLDEIKKQASGIKITGEHFFSPTERDFRTLIAKAVAEKPDTFLVLSFPPTLDVLIRQMLEAGATHLSSIESFAMSDFPVQLEGSWCVTGADPSEKFRHDYTARFHIKPNWSAYYGYDIARMIVQAIEATGNGKTIPDNDKVSAALRQTRDFDGTCGKISINPEGIVQSPVVVKQFKAGKATTLDAAK